MKKSVMAALAAFLLVVALAQPAEAKRNRPVSSQGSVTEFCGDRYGPCQTAAAPARAAKKKHIARRAPAAAPAEPRIEAQTWRPYPDRCATDRPGLICSHKTGATARVAEKYRAQFQAYVDNVEDAGGRITFMGGIRAGPCSIPRSKHPCGMAIDLCQFGRGIVDRRCTLPRQLASIAARHGLVEGGVWCHGDLGHAEIRTGRQAEACGSNLYSAISKFKKRVGHKYRRFARLQP